MLMHRTACLFAAVLLSGVLLTSCTGRSNPDAAENVPSGGVMRDTISETEALTTAEPELLPDCVGLYDDLTESGTYTRLDKWESPWVSGQDIAVFDVIPSRESVIDGGAYRAMWLAESEKVSPGVPVTAHLLLEYSTTDGVHHSVALDTWRDAESAAEPGYLEVYLYDDIHQEEGTWYSHLTEDTTNAETVVSSVKLTAGSLIGEVTSIRLTAYMTSPEAGAAVQLTPSAGE